MRKASLITQYDEKDNASEEVNLKPHAEPVITWEIFARKQTKNV